MSTAATDLAALNATAGVPESGNITGLSDSRVVEDTTLLPFSAIGQFALSFDGELASASGVLISDTHVLTVASAFVDTAAGAPPEEIIFTPGLAGDGAPFGSAFGVDVWTPPQFQAFAEDFHYDFAVVELDRPLGAEAGSLPFASTDGLDLEGATLSAAGFSDVTGPQMIAGTAAVQQTDGNLVLTYLDALPGSSGSPVFVEGDESQTLSGIMFGVGEEGEANFALRLTDDIVARLETAVDHGLDILRDFGPAEYPGDPAEVFDAGFYLAGNPDVAAAVEAGAFPDAFTHYQEFGRFEGRNPTDWFDGEFYLLANPDVADAGLDPFTHFLRHGQFEERLTSGTLDDIPDDALDFPRSVEQAFDEAFYLMDNPLVALAVAGGTFDSGFDHYQTFGRSEGRDPTDWFDTTFYLKTHTDVAEAGVDPFNHFLRYGQFEGRVTAPLAESAEDFQLFG